MFGIEKRLVLGVLTYALRRALMLGGAELVRRNWTTEALWVPFAEAAVLIIADFAWSMYDKAKKTGAPPDVQ